jgi:hypothetical protein
MDNIYLPVSLGEAIDKLTILHIKLDKITDDRRIDVQKEYDLLYEKLSEFIIKYNDLYQSMKKVNLLIWDMMDILRDGNVDETIYLKICKDCIEYNDIRFRVKNKINYLSNSSLKEQKSYKINRLLIEINPNIINIADLIRPIKYFSFFYDEVIIIHNKNSGLIDEFKYDPTVLFLDNVDETTTIKKVISLTENTYNKEHVFIKLGITEEEIYRIL